MRTICKISAILILLFTTFTGSAQSRSYRIFDEFAHKDGFINLAFSKAMIDAVDLNIDEENKKITGDLMEIRILISDREKNKIEGSLHKIISGKFQKMDYKKKKIIMSNSQSTKWFKIYTIEDKIYFTGRTKESRFVSS
ncbi:MAG: hypothetical protein WCL21_05680 [Mariniphaga sp.]